MQTVFHSPPDAPERPRTPAATPAQALPADAVQPDAAVIEIGGPPGPEPTRFGDWERKGRCIDF